MVWNPGEEQDIKQKKRGKCCSVRRHRKINPKSEAPRPQTTHPHRHVEENEARRRHRGRGVRPARPRLRGACGQRGHVFPCL